MYPSACSFVPFFEKQSNLVFTNFLSTHYGLNNPQIILLRFEAQEEGEIIEKYKTLILLPEQTIWFNKNFVDEKEMHKFSRGQLFVYLFDPLFKPSHSQVRYHVIYEKNSHPTCGVHSWVSHTDELIIKHKQFLSRRYISNNDTKGSYFMVPPFGEIVKCQKSQNNFEIRKTTDKSIIDTPYELFPKNKTQRGGFFINLDDEKYISRIWHDNGTGIKYPVSKNDLGKKEIKETDFCFPSQGYYFNLIIPNPVGKNLVIESNIKISALETGTEKIFLEEEIDDSELIKPKGNLFAFEIKLKKFFEKLNSILSEEEKKKNNFIRINLKFEARNSNIGDVLDEFTAYLYMFDMNDNVCDQIHNEWSKSSIYGGTKFVSYRTNKFAPFKLQDNCESYAILKNKININENEKKLKNHKIRVTINYSKKLNNEEITENKTEYLDFNINQKFKIINIRELFFKNEKNLTQITGGVHIFVAL